MCESQSLSLHSHEPTIIFPRSHTHCNPELIWTYPDGLYVKKQVSQSVEPDIKWTLLYYLPSTKSVWYPIEPLIWIIHSKQAGMLMSFLSCKWHKTGDMQISKENLDIWELMLVRADAKFARPIHGMASDMVVYDLSDHSLIWPKAQLNSKLKAFKRQYHQIGDQWLDWKQLQNMMLF